MTDDEQTLWESRTLPDDITLELRAGDNPALILLQGENRVQVGLAHVKGVVAAMADAAADLAEFLAIGPWACRGHGFDAVVGRWRKA